MRHTDDAAPLLRDDNPTGIGQAGDATTNPDDHLNSQVSLSDSASLPPSPFQSEPPASSDTARESPPLPTDGDLSHRSMSWWPCADRSSVAVCFLAMTVAPWALSAGIYWTMVAGTAGSECPFVPVNQTARDQINALVGMNSVKRKAAFSSLDEATYLQLLRDTDDGFLTETWLAAIPAYIRAAFGAWLVWKLVFTAAEIDRRVYAGRGLAAMVVAGHGLRRSVVGSGTTNDANAAGWLAIAGTRSDWAADSPELMEEIGEIHAVVLSFFMLWVVVALGLSVSGSQGQEVAFSLGVGSLCALILMFSCCSSFSLKDALDRAQQQHCRQPTWDKARLALGLIGYGETDSRRQAIVLSSLRFLFWHNSQPVVYLLVFWHYFPCYDFMDGLQRAIGSLIAAREAMYLISTVVAVFACPVYLLLDVETVWTEAETLVEKSYRMLAYFTAPHNFVLHCLANRSVAMRLVVGPLFFFNFVADFLSWFTLLPLLLRGTRSPAALKIGYLITSASFVLFFGPLSVRELVRISLETKPWGYKVTKALTGLYMFFAAVLALCLSNMILSGIFAVFSEVDVACSSFFFTALGPDCGDHSVCGVANKGECGPCSDGYVDESTPSPLFASAIDACQLAPAYVLSGATDPTHNGRYERLTDHVCNGAPVYRLGGEGGNVLYRYLSENDESCRGWFVGPSQHIADCGNYNDWFIGTWNSDKSPDWSLDQGSSGFWFEQPQNNTTIDAERSLSDWHELGWNCAGPERLAHAFLNRDILVIVG